MVCWVYRKSGEGVAEGCWDACSSCAEESSLGRVGASPAILAPVGGTVEGWLKNRSDGAGADRFFGGFQGLSPINIKQVAPAARFYEDVSFGVGAIFEIIAMSEISETGSREV